VAARLSAAEETLIKTVSAIAILMATTYFVVLGAGYLLAVGGLAFGSISVVGSCLTISNEALKRSVFDL